MNFIPFPTVVSDHLAELQRSSARARRTRSTRWHRVRRAPAAPSPSDVRRVV